MGGEAIIAPEQPAVLDELEDDNNDSELRTEDEDQLDPVASFLEQHGDKLTKNHRGEVVTYFEAVEVCPALPMMIVALGNAALGLTAAEAIKEESEETEPGDEKEEKALSEEKISKESNEHDKSARIKNLPSVKAELPSQQPTENITPSSPGVTNFKNELPDPTADKRPRKNVLITEHADARKDTAVASPLRDVGIAEGRISADNHATDASRTFIGDLPKRTDIEIVMEVVQKTKKAITEKNPLLRIKKIVEALPSVVEHNTEALPPVVERIDTSYVATKSPFAIGGVAYQEHYQTAHANINGIQEPYAPLIDGSSTENNSNITQDLSSQLPEKPVDETLTSGYSLDTSNLTGTEQTEIETEGDPIDDSDLIQATESDSTVPIYEFDGQYSNSELLVSTEQVEEVITLITEHFETLEPGSVNEVYQLLDALIVKITELQATSFDTAMDIIDKFEYKTTSIDSLNSGEASIQPELTTVLGVEEELKELFIKVFQQLEIGYSPDSIESFIRLCLNIDFIDALPEDEAESGLQDRGTHEFIMQIIVALKRVKQAAQQSYVVGKAALQFYTVQFTPLKVV